MTGWTAERIWDAAAEPARRAQARMLDGAAELLQRAQAQAEFAGCVQTLGALRLRIIELLTRDEDGILSQISSEYAAMNNLLEARSTATAA